MKVSASTMSEVYSASDLERIHPPAWEEGMNLFSTARKIPLILRE